MPSNESTNQDHDNMSVPALIAIARPFGYSGTAPNPENCSQWLSVAWRLFKAYFPIALSAFVDVYTCVSTVGDSGAAVALVNWQAVSLLSLGLSAFWTCDEVSAEYAASTSKLFCCGHWVCLCFSM